MRIVHLFDDYGTPGERALAGEGSVSSVVYYLARCSAAKGHEVTVLERDHGTLPSEELIDGVRYVRFHANELPAAPYALIKSPLGLVRLIRDGFAVAAKTNRYLKENEFDIVHVHFPFAACILVLLNRRLRKKIVYTAHIGEEKTRFGLDFSVSLVLKLFSPDLFVMRRVRRSVVLNEPLWAKLVERGIAAEQLKVIPNGVMLADFNVNEAEVERVRTKYGLDRRPTVLFAGTITPRKGVEYLLRAAELLQNEDVLFLVVGNTNLDSDYAERMRAYAQERKLEAKFTGFVPYADLKALYAACAVFVLPSLEEGFGVVLTEALAAGKPVVGTNVGGIPAQIRDGWNGFLIESANAQQLAEKLRYLIDHPEERKGMGDNSRKLAEEEFDWRQIAERYLRVYAEIV
ncbi:MAG: glycosyltransferase family 4 protein [Methanomicrobia archaeon]|nr:glycosyltransferase family 4 protein [Methanomicrobia archaeon]